LPKSLIQDTPHFVKISENLFKIRFTPTKTFNCIVSYLTFTFSLLLERKKFSPAASTIREIIALSVVKKPQLLFTLDLMACQYMHVLFATFAWVDFSIFTLSSNAQFWKTCRNLKSPINSDDIYWLIVYTAMLNECLSLWFSFLDFSSNLSYMLCFTSASRKIC